MGSAAAGRGADFQAPSGAVASFATDEGSGARRICARAEPGDRGAAGARMLARWSGRVAVAGSDSAEQCDMGPSMQTLVVGVAGATGSGKTTVARRLAESVAGHVGVLQHDSYYRDRPDLTYEERCELNFDHPDSLETELLVEHLTKLRAGEGVGVPVYDFTTHRRGEQTSPVVPAPVLLVEGILVLADARLRELLDIKVFVDTDADLRVFRRIRRDIEQRGRTFEQIRQQYYASVRPMTLQFVEPSKRWADIIVPEGGRNEVALDLLTAKLMSVVREA